MKGYMVSIFEFPCNRPVVEFTEIFSNKGCALDYIMGFESDCDFRITIIPCDLKIGDFQEK